METVRDVFKSAEDVIFDHISSTAPSEDLFIKILKGICLERKYVCEKACTKGFFKNIICPAHVNIHAGVSKYYKNQANEKLFKKNN